MTRQDFKKCIEKIQAVADLSDKLSKLNIETIDCVELFAAEEIFFLWVKSEFGEEAEDLASWWVYEDVKKTIYEKDGTETHLDDEDALYDYLVSNFK